MFSLFKSFLSSFLLACLIGVSTAFAATSWPGTSGQQLAVAGSNGFPGNAEPSGLIQMDMGLIVASDNGRIYVLDEQGNMINDFQPGGDIEGLTTMDPSSSIIYLGIENPDAIKEFDLSTGQLTGEEWDLTPWMSSSEDNQGLEALTYADGHFYAGLQADAHIYEFELLPGGSVNFIQEFGTYYSSDLAGLYYDETTGLLYSVYDSRNRLVVTDLLNNNTVVERYNLPGHDQEGITLELYPSTTMYIAHDKGPGAVFSYGNFPSAQPANLYVENVQINPTTLRVTYDVGNNGGQNMYVDRFGYDRLYIDGMSVTTRAWSTAGSGASQFSLAHSLVHNDWLVSFNLYLLSTFQQGGAHTVMVCVDDGNVFPEILEDDNCAEGEWEFEKDMMRMEEHNQHTRRSMFRDR